MDKEIILMADSLRHTETSFLITSAEKIPVTKWRKFTSGIPTRGELQNMLNSPHAHSVATIGGRVSGGLEIIDFEGESKAGKCVFRDWGEIVESHNLELYEKLVFSTSPSGGMHVRYRYEGCEKSKKLAIGKNKKVLIETRGEGAYALCPPSKGYRMMQGDLTKIPEISLEDRNFLISIARSFNEVAEKAEFSHGIDAALSDLPGNDYNNRGDHRALLEKHGWIMVLERKKVQYWRRPGKDKSWSATWNFIPDRFYPFSSNAEPFESDKLYHKFAMLTFLEYDGDFKAATKALSEQGKSKKKLPLNPIEEKRNLSILK